MSTTDTTATGTETTAVEPDSTNAGETTVVDTATTPVAEIGAGGDSGAEDQGDELDEDQDAGDGKGGREAAKYRRRLRETEAERDTLAATVEAMQRAEVERIAAADELKPAALWGSGVELAGLLNDDGTVDGAKVAEAIEAARETLGISRPAFNTREGLPLRRPAKPSGREAMVGIVMGRGVADDV